MKKVKKLKKSKGDELMSSNKKIKLGDEDWAHLLPGKSITVGKTVIDIKPLGLEDFMALLRKLSSVREILAKEGVTFENYSEGEGLLKLSQVIALNVPEVVSEASNIDVEDIRKLPISCILKIVSTVIEVNIESQEGLVKNLEALAGKMTSLMGSLSEK